MISHLGTFDVENYGDLLYPLVFRHLLHKHNAALKVQQYSPLKGQARQEVGFETHPILILFKSATGPSQGIVIGGGDILRTDWDLVARHYGRNSRVSYRRLLHTIGTAGAVGYFLREKLPGLEPDSFYAHRFRARWMNYPAVGPFLINPDQLPWRSAIAYLSCGVPHDFAAAEKDRVKQALDQARFIYVRDDLSAEKLRRAGVLSRVHIAPDVTVTLSDQFPRASEARRGQEIIQRLGISGLRRVLCFQSQPYPGFSEQEIVQQLRRYSERTCSDVVLLPTGYCHGDHEFLQSISNQSGGTFKYVRACSVFDVIAVIAASDVFVGTSLHGNITAFSFGIPHLFGPLPVAKAEGFLNIVNLPPELKLRSWGGMNDKLEMLAGIDPTLFARLAAEAKAKVYQTVDELFASLLR